jgi:hypothetical protein
VRSALSILILVALHSMSAAAPSHAMLQGRVIDLRGRPLVGVVVSAQSWQSVPLGSANSDGNGQFRINVPSAPSDITLVAEPPGYLRFALTGFKAGGAPVLVRLTRKIDAAYLKDLTQATDDKQFRELAVDLLSPSEGTVGESLPMATILPLLSALRPRLRAYVTTDVAQLSRRDLPKDQDRAMLLLAWRSDLLDDALVDVWGTAQKLSIRPARRCSGPTLHAALAAWETLHFEKEGYKPGAPRPHASVHIEQAPGGDHAIAMVSVMYAHWGYSQRVILGRTQKDWEVRRVLSHEHWHGRD